ncbi:MAG: cell division protein FtsA [Rhodospirillaceae bacterium]|nr:cell division protein FtsA [Rhodospirillaceae bacterium]
MRSGSITSSTDRKGVGKRVTPRRGLIAALDVGTAKICCFISRIEDDGTLEVVGIGHQVAQGTRAGAIVDMSAVESSIREVLQAAEDMAGDTVRTVLVGVTGCQPHSRTLKIELELGGHEVSEADLKRVFERSNSEETRQDRVVLHGLPVGYEIDGLQGIRDPRGMRGEKLLVRMHVVSGARSTIRNLTNCVGRCHLDTEALVLSPYASGLASLVEDELDLGAICIDMGAGITSIAVFQNNAMMYSDAVPIGGWHVTSDIARGLDTSMRDAERLKTLFGSAIINDVDNKDMIDVPLLGERDATVPNHISRDILIGVVRPRLEEVFELVRDRLDAVGFGKSGIMRVVLTGGASQLSGLRDLASNILGKHVRLGGPPPIPGLAQSMRNPAFATCAGLLLYAAQQADVAGIFRTGQFPESEGHIGRFGQWFRDNF